MKKKFLAILLAIATLVVAMAGCEIPGSTKDSTSSSSSVSSSSETPKAEYIDFAADLKLDMTSPSQKVEVTVKLFIDGDTTHFLFPKNQKYPEAAERLGYFKARYAACNTPESTGDIEPWGKYASDFTKTKLSEAQSIIIESDEDEWTVDSTGERYITWVWYKPQGATDYRNLNLELLQECLAFSSKAAESRYGTVCQQAYANAMLMKEKVHNQDVQDPSFHYGEAIPTTLKSIRMDMERYNNVKVAFDATIAYIDATTNVYLEDFDADTGITFGLPAFTGYNNGLNDQAFMKAGNRIRAIGIVTISESFGAQISDLAYEDMRPDDPDNTQLLEENFGVKYREVDVETFNSTVTLEVTKTVDGEEVVEDVEFAYGALAEGSSIRMTNLYVMRGWTSEKETSNNEIALYCRDAEGNQITVHTHPLVKNYLQKPYEYASHSDYVGKTINVLGIVSSYNDTFQIEVFFYNAITVVA